MASPITKIEHGVLHSTLRCLEKAGVTTDDAEWMRRGRNAELLAQFIRQQQRRGSVPGALQVVVRSDAQISFKGRMDEGNYDRVYDGLYSMENKGTVWVRESYSVDIELISGLQMQERFRERLGYLAGEDVREQLQHRGYRSLTSPEILALGAAYPDEQKKYKVVSAEGSIRTGHERREAYLSLGYGKAVGRTLNLEDVNLFWDHETRFAAVEINPTPTAARRRSR